jgi:hypothetical protein
MLTKSGLCRPVVTTLSNIKSCGDPFIRSLAVTYELMDTDRYGEYKRRTFANFCYDRAELKRVLYDFSYLFVFILISSSSSSFDGLTDLVWPRSELMETINLIESRWDSLGGGWTRHNVATDTQNKRRHISFPRVGLKPTITLLECVATVSVFMHCRYWLVPQFLIREEFCPHFGGNSSHENVSSWICPSTFFSTLKIEPLSCSEGAQQQMHQWDACLNCCESCF